MLSKCDIEDTPHAGMEYRFVLEVISLVEVYLLPEHAGNDRDMEPVCVDLTDPIDRVDEAIGVAVGLSQ